MSDRLTKRDFTCAFCHGEFESSRTEAEAATLLTEEMGRYGEADPDKMAVVCEDCFRRLDAAYPAEAFAEDRAAGTERHIRLPDGDGLPESL